MVKSKSFLFFGTIGIVVVGGFGVHPILGAVLLTIAIAICFWMINNTMARSVRRDLPLLPPALTDLTDVEPISALCNKGKFRYQTNNWELAMADFSEALAIDDGHIEALYYRGICHKYLGDLAAAQADLIKASMICKDTQENYFAPEIERQLAEIELDRNASNSDNSISTSAL
jgi:tetratricopeptide (TPR) repeat protein